MEGEAINQPAGHWEQHESLYEAAVREVFEETGCQFTPQGLVGCYQWTIPGTETTYLRFCFYGQVQKCIDNMALDEGIISAEWYTREELETSSIPMRSPLVLTCINDYLEGKQYPLEILNIVN